MGAGGGAPPTPGSVDTGQDYGEPATVSVDQPRTLQHSWRRRPTASGHTCWYTVIALNSGEIAFVTRSRGWSDLNAGARGGGMACGARYASAEAVLRSRIGRCVRRRFARLSHAGIFRCLPSSMISRGDTQRKGSATGASDPNESDSSRAALASGRGAHNDVPGDGVTSTGPALGPARRRSPAS